MLADSGPPFSHTLDKIGNKEIGLLLHGSSKSPSLKVGDTSAIFQSLGKVQVVLKEEFIMEVIEGIIPGAESLIA